MMTDAGDPTQQMSEEQLRAALGEMRAGPVDVMIAQVLQMLLEGAQIKLGRNDARLLIDLAALISDQAGPHVDAGLTDQVQQAVQQLRLAQVEAEAQVAQQGAPEPNDLAGRAQAAGPADAAATPPQATAPPQAPPGPDGGSRLWTPGG